jgi:hypothetical protein
MRKLHFDRVKLEEELRLVKSQNLRLSGVIKQLEANLMYLSRTVPDNVEYKRGYKNAAIDILHTLDSLTKQ